MIYRSRDSKAVSAWIRDCRGAYTHGGETVCAGFHLYRGFVGCPAWAAGQPCSYCYLKTTFRTDPELREGVAWGKLLDTIQRCRLAPLSVKPARAAVDKWLKAEWLLTDGNGNVLSQHMPATSSIGPGRWPGDTQLLNASELADSLGFTPDENPHVGMLLDLFSSPDTNPYGQKLLLVTKAGVEGTQAHLAGREPSENVILSWSVGNDRPSEPWWPDVLIGEGRRWAAAWARARGWRVRWRIDPLVPWHEGLGVEGGVGTPRNWCWTLPEQISSELYPELVTLGTLRHQGGRVMLPDEERVGIYRQAIEGLRDGGYEGEIGVCKETPAIIRTVLGIEPNDMRCNCLP